ncbi:MAG: sulfatase [Bacteroidota bacterium]
MRIVFYALFILTFFVTCKPSPAPANAPEKETVRAPNILLIVADDLGWADLNCYGNPLIETPNLDALARRGIQCLDGYASAPVCSPSRASIQTGLHPARIGMTEHLHGYYDNPDWPLSPPRIPQGLDLEHETIGELAQRAGYFTAHVGKWHLGNQDFHPSKQGYDRTYAGGHYGLPKSFYYPFFDGEPFPDLLAATKEGDYLTDALTDHALELMDEWQGANWLISLNFYAPHVPIQGRKDWVEHYQNVIAATHYRKFPTLEYAAMVSTIDENVGRLVDALEAQEQLDSTLIIFLSDNGGLHVREVPGFDQHTPPTDNGILRTGKGYVYEGGIRIPFIVHYPAIAETERASLEPVVTTDIYPTLCELFGRQDFSPSPDGRSLLPLLRGETPEERTLYWHFPHYSPQGGKPAAAVRRGDHKLYLDYERDSVTYFNVRALPDESRGMPTGPEGSDLREALRVWKREVRAREATAKGR